MRKRIRKNLSKDSPSLSTSMREIRRKLRTYAWLSLLLSALMLIKVAPLMRCVWRKPSPTGTKTQ